VEKITQQYAYSELLRLFNQNASDEKIANLAFDFLYAWSKDNSPESRNIIYDLALIGEPGMELTRNDIKELIDSLVE
jgi:hypothetical protein